MPLLYLYGVDDATKLNTTVFAVPIAPSLISDRTPCDQQMSIYQATPPFQSQITAPTNPFSKYFPDLSAFQDTPPSRSNQTTVCRPLFMPVIDRFNCSIRTNSQVRQFSCIWTEFKFMRKLRQSHVAAYCPRMPVSPIGVKMVRFTIPKRTIGKGAADDGMFDQINCAVYLCSKILPR